jgi:hypothetical protein
VTLGWQSKLSRVAHMDWEEIRVRAAQEFYKRADVLAHRMGVRQGAVGLDTSAATAPGVFFFAAGEVSTRAQLIRQNLAEEANTILNDANQICEHHFRLLGYENLRFTPDESKNNSKSNFRSKSNEADIDINWHLDPVHGKRAALDPWFKISFLDFAAVGDHKVTWELNRHQHLVTLAKAWLLTGDEKYIRELIAQWHSWMQANPYPRGINWASTLEVAFRSLSWIWIDQLLATGETSASAEALSIFRAELAPALAFHGRYMERNLSTYFSPNTHLLGEAVALFFLGTLYPQMPHASKWRESGWRIILDAAKRQVRPDGVYFEQSLYYHVYALDFFLHARLLAARNDVMIPSEFDATLNKMLDVVEALAQAGPAENFGDDDGGRLFNSRRNRTEYMTDPLALGAVLFSRDSFAGRLTEEALWLFGNEAVEKVSHRNSSSQRTDAIRSAAFPEGGIYVLADSQPYPQLMALDAGPQGVGRSGHGHADALSLRLTMNGRRWLVDSGSGVYIAKDPADRDAFRGTGAHNTMRVDGLDQAVAGEPFSWTHIPTTTAENWIAGKTFTYFVGSHNGYERLSDPVIHRRHVVKIAGDLWMVRDVAIGHSEHEIEVRWHFAPDLEPRAVAPGRIEIAPTATQSGDASMTLIVPEGSIWQSATDFTRTVVSPAYGARQPAPLVRSHAHVSLPSELATILLPERRSVEQSDKPLLTSGQMHSAAQFEPRLASMAQAAVQVYELAYHHLSHGFFFARGKESWSFGPWSSDARVLYCRIEQETLQHLVVIGGSQVAWQGQELLRSAQAFDFFEWRRKEPEMTKPEGISLTPLFAALTDPDKAGNDAANSLSTATSDRRSSSYAEKH